MNRVYVMQDALDAIELLVPCQYGERISICDGIDIRFTDVGHLLRIGQYRSVGDGR